MASRAVVLGGGGVIGVAWHTGVVCGLRDQGFDPGAADLLAGTSAGSIVAAQLAGGLPFDELYEAQRRPSDGSTEGRMEGLLSEIDVQSLSAIFGKWSKVTEMTEVIAAEIGAMALLAKTPSEEQLLSTFRQTGYLVDDWPEKRLLIAAVDAESGRLVAWERSSNVPLYLAIASSCAVPGLFPPITINGRRYVDGGVRSGTSADLAQGHEQALVVAPLGASEAGIGGISRRALEAEVAILRGSGSAVEVLMPDAEAMEAFGPNLMDPARTGPAAEAGRRQGRTLAERLLGVWR